MVIWLHNLQGNLQLNSLFETSERLEGCFLGSKYGRMLTEIISSTSGHRHTECVRPP